MDSLHRANGKLNNRSVPAAGRRWWRPGCVSVAVALLLTPMAVAQADPDLEWRELRMQSRPRSPEISPAADATALAAARVKLAGEYIAQADRLRDFHLRNPQHKSAKEAKRLEALVLLYAAYAGDTTQDLRRNTLVAEIRRDPAIPERLRLEVVAYAQNLAVSRRSSLTRSAKDAALADVRLALETEFPNASDQERLKPPLSRAAATTEKSRATESRATRSPSGTTEAVRP